MLNAGYLGMTLSERFHWIKRGLVSLVFRRQTVMEALAPSPHSSVPSRARCDFLRVTPVGWLQLHLTASQHGSDNTITNYCIPVLLDSAHS